MPVSDAKGKDHLEVVPLGDGRYRVTDGGRTHVAFAIAAQDTWVFLDGRVYLISSATGASARSVTTDDANALASPMPATVVSIDVEAGQSVTRDAVLIMLEAMKMELPIRAPRDGKVTAIHCRRGELVQPGVPLLELS
jgi:acetyl/propionyl-CoA carboxylase alpha subunit